MMEVSMDSRKFILKETLIIALGQALCVGVMLGIFALLGQFHRKVLLGGIVGGTLSVLNFFFMSVAAMIAADKATAQDVKGGKDTLRLSLTGRLIVMAVVLIAFAKSGLCNVLALVLPLAFNRPILTITEFFRKAGGPENEY